MQWQTKLYSMQKQEEEEEQNQGTIRKKTLNSLEQNRSKDMDARRKERGRKWGMKLRQKYTVKNIGGRTKRKNNENRITKQLWTKQNQGQRREKKGERKEMRNENETEKYSA